MTDTKFHSKVYSLISVILSGLCIAIIIKINTDIAHRYLQSDGKTKALFGITETLVFYYQYYFIGLSLIALILAIIGTKRKENRLVNRLAYIIGLLSLIIIFLRVWRLMI
jgi:uncharacterized membrane protein YdcZ (DUF606 family)